MKPAIVEVEVPDGTAFAHLYVPEHPGPHPLVVSFMDAAGLRPAMAELAVPLIESGYAVLQPELYWRSGPYAPFDYGSMFSDPAERARVFGLMGAVHHTQVTSDLGAFLEHLGGDSRLRTDRIGLIGYCMGGRQAFFVAAALGDRVAAMASIHGGGLVTAGDDSPHLAGARIRARLYFAVAGDDNSCSPAHLASLTQALATEGVGHQIELFPTARHGFAASDCPVHHPDATDRQWRRVLGLFAETLW